MLGKQFSITSKQIFSPSLSQSNQSTRKSTPFATVCKWWVKCIFGFDSDFTVFASNNFKGSISQELYSFVKSSPYTCPVTDVKWYSAGSLRKLPFQEWTGVACRSVEYYFKKISRLNTKILLYLLLPGCWVLIDVSRIPLTKAFLPPKIKKNWISNLFTCIFLFIFLP